jgi:hypothetical protein
MFGISYVNLLTLMKGTPTADPVAATGFPVTNLYDGWPWRPFRFGTGGVVNAVNFDTSSVIEDFEVAFSGGLPPQPTNAVWSKTAGATVTRNTTDMFSGAGCMQVVGSSFADYVALTFDWPAGAIFAWRFYLRSLTNVLSENPGAAASVQLLDIDSRKRLYEISSIPGTNIRALVWHEQGTVFASNGTTSWVKQTSSVRVRTPTEVGRATTRLQLRFYAGQTGALYDLVKLWPIPDFVATLGHNLPPSSGDSAEAVPQAQTGGILWKVGDPTSPVPAINTRFAMGVGLPTTWAREIAGFAAPEPGGGEFATLKCPRPPIVDPIAYGLVWTGALVQLPEGPEYPIQVREMFPQERAGGGGYESQAVRRADLAPRRLELSVSGSTVDRVEEVLAALRHARYGTDRVVLIAPYKNVDTLFYGRVLGPDGLATTQGAFNSVRATVIFEEEPFFKFGA